MDMKETPHMDMKAFSEIVPAISNLSDMLGELTAAIEAIQSASPSIVRSCVTCITCIFFDEKPEHCKFNGYNQRPPARIIAFGCGKHMDEYVPF